MPFAITKAPRDLKTPVHPPVKPAGGLWAYGVLLPGYRYVAWGDTASNIVAAMLGDEEYSEKTDQERLTARILRALRLQVTTQARINASAMVTGEWDALCEWERAVLNGPRHVAPNMPGGFPTRDMFNGLDVWTAETPLMCLTTACEPLNPGVPPILGTDDNLWVLDPLDDESLLDSLEELGLIRTFTRSSSD